MNNRIGRVPVKKCFTILLCVLMVLSIVPLSASANAEDADNGCIENASLEDLAGKVAGVITGTPQDDMVKSNVKDPEILYFNTFTDMALALQQGKIDYYVNSTISFRIMQENYPDFGYINSVLRSFVIGSIFPKTEAGDRLRDEFNKYLAEINENGTLAELQEYWLNPNDWGNIEIPESGTAGTIELAALSSVKPFSFKLNNEFVGLDIAVIAGFCRERGYGLHISDVDYAGALSGISSGKYDMAAGQISWTEERAEKVLYSDFYCRQEIVPIVRKADYTTSTDNSGRLPLEEGALADVTLEDLAGKTAGVMTGTPQADFVKEAIKDPEILYFNDFTDLAVALEQGKIDYCMNSTVAFRIMHETYPEFAYVPYPVKSLDIGTIFPKTEHGEQLQSQLNEYLTKIKADGTLESLQNYWLYPNDWEKVTFPETGDNGTLIMGGVVSMKPFCFVLNGGYGGLDIAIIAGFCKEYGYGLQIENVNFSGAISGVASGKYDLAAGQLIYTEERAESVLYSDFYSQQYLVPFVLAENYASSASATGSVNSDTSFLHTIRESFHRTLFEENRYQLILSGLGITLEITVFGFLLANMFGVLFCALAMSKHRFLQMLADIYSRIMQGTPVVVILMILFYVIFKGRQFSGVMIASVGFGITFGAYLAQLFEGAIRGVDQGQTEAALAIGFSPLQAFNGIVLPQATRSMLPGYFSQLISMMKGTAIVGYIAVTDLTKAGDIIRSSTFEPFLPLIIVALLYLVLASILISIMKMIQKRLEPKRVQSVTDEETEL